MTDSMLNIITGFLLPALLISGSIYWTIKIRYSKRYLPTIINFILMILVIVVPLFLVSIDVIKADFGPMILSMYYTFALAVAVAGNLIVIFVIKRE